MGLLATGGSTNHVLHLPAIARAAGIAIDWSNIDALSAAVPLIARTYPGGSGDVNAFHQAGGMAFVIGSLLDAGLLHGDVLTVWEGGLAAHAREPVLDADTLAWHPVPHSRDDTMLRPPHEPFLPDGGMRLLQGNLGHATFKTSAADPSRWTVEAPARVFADQDDVLKAYHVSAEGAGRRRAGPVARRRHCPGVGRRRNDRRLIDSAEWAARDRAAAPPPPPPIGTGRELFAFLRHGAGIAEQGGSAMLAAMGRDIADGEIDEPEALTPASRTARPTHDYA